MAFGLGINISALLSDLPETPTIKSQSQQLDYIKKVFVNEKNLDYIAFAMEIKDMGLKPANLRKLLTFLKSISDKE